MVEAYPLYWPIGYKRTEPGQTISSRFKITPDAAHSFLRDEIKRIGGKDLIISSNCHLKRDGGIYASDLAKSLSEPGIAIYFKYKGKEISMCCDKYQRPYENLYALARTINALRQIERDGVSDFIDRSFTGFKAIPEKVDFNQKSIWQILGFAEMPGSIDVVHSNYRLKAKQVHPDSPLGSHEAFVELNEAYNQACLIFKNKS